MHKKSTLVLTLFVLLVAATASAEGTNPSDDGVIYDAPAIQQVEDKGTTQPAQVAGQTAPQSDPGTSTAAESVPLRMPFQGFLTDASGTPIGAGSPATVDIDVEIHTHPVNNTLVWGPESHNNVPVADGVFAIPLGGNGAPLDVADFAGGGPLYLEVTVDGTTQTPRTPLLTSPFAMHAYSADVAIADDGDWNFSGNDLISGVPGDVGIGDVTPDAKLDVSSGAAKGIEVTNSGGTVNHALVARNSVGTAARFESPNANSNGFPSTPACIYAPAGAGDTGAFLTADTGYALLARVDDTGVAVRGWDFGGLGKAGQFDGTVNISDQLTVGSDDIESHDFYLRHQQFTNGGMVLENGFTGNTWQFYVSQSIDDLRLLYNASFRGAFDDVTGNYTPVSDRRLKEAIEPLPNMLDKVMALEPREYSMIDDPNAARHFGFIAQELEQVLPNVVSTTADDGDGITDLKTVAYTELIPVLMRATQEQQRLIEALEARLEALER